MKRQSGFTMMELMIVMVIIGILAAIAFPSYGDYVLRSNRTVGKTVMMRIIGQQESFFNDRKSYALTLASLQGGYADPMFVKKDGNLVTATCNECVYQLALTNPTATSFTVTATPIRQQLKDTGCGTLSVDNIGNKAATGTNTDCWIR